MQTNPMEFPARRSAGQGVDALRIPEALLKIQTVVAVTGLSEPTIRRRIRSGDFPEPIRMGTRCSRWVALEVSDWLRGKAAAA